MTIEHERLCNLIEFAQKSVQLKKKSVLDISLYKDYFLEYEHNFLDLPGIHFNVVTDNKVIWLLIERLEHIPPPNPGSDLLAVWLNLSNSPDKNPTLYGHVDTKKLIASGHMLVPTLEQYTSNPQIVSLDSFEQRAEVEKQFANYLDNVWMPWSVEARHRQKSIDLYSRFFRLGQHIEGNLGETQIEFVWGVGMAIWKTSEVLIYSPLITQAIELLFNVETGHIEICPSTIFSAEDENPHENEAFKQGAISPKLESDIFSQINDPGVNNLEKQATLFFKQCKKAFSPFQPDSFQPVLQLARTCLDPDGIFWRSQTSPDNRCLPAVGDTLKVTDTWVLFARPKSTNLFIHDLERFREQLKNYQLDLPDAVANLVTEPSNVHKETALPEFRGVSLINKNAENASAQDLFFPKPFNDEQLRIMQLLENHAGVVVQGPPGTGKTHTIANVICHYLAHGKRILVTSMKEPALAVLREKLPLSIQPLTISLLSSEQEGMRQFELAISTIATGVQTINKSKLLREINKLENEIDSFHTLLAQIDQQIETLTRLNLQDIVIEQETISPVDAACELAGIITDMRWLDDELSVESCHNPLFSRDDIVHLGVIRRQIGKDIDYLDAVLPEGCFPDTQDIIQLHQNLVNLSRLEKTMLSENFPPLINYSEATFEIIQRLADKLSSLLVLYKTIKAVEYQWASVELALIPENDHPKIFQTVAALANELEQIATEKKPFCIKPVLVPDNIDKNSTLVQTIKNLATGNKGFTLNGLLTKSRNKKILDSIRVENQAPDNLKSWQHVYDYICLLKRQTNLVIRWNKLNANIPLLLELQPEASQLDKINQFYALQQKYKEINNLEQGITKDLQWLFPAWQKISQPSEQSTFREALTILVHHIDYHRVAGSNQQIETIRNQLAGCNGAISAQIRLFLDSRLGSTNLSNSDCLKEWNYLINELQRLLKLKPLFEQLQAITALIKNSGAPRFAKRLQTELWNASEDLVLPEQWLQIWRLRRLANYLKKLDNRTQLKNLGKDRLITETKLALAYEQIVTWKTWVKLIEKSTPAVCTALQAYRLAIARIGTGSGIRSSRYRQDAINAARKAQPAIPCWIMPHYRISESLPAEFGCFDVVIIDEASQSDLTALPAILRAKKILVVGDDLQVSPDGIGEKEHKIKELSDRYLGNQVENYASLMTPERSIYDLFLTVFSTSRVELQEHFRCVAPIIEFSKREFYSHKLKPLRIATATERLEPPLIDVFIENGTREKEQKINLAEAKYISEEIKTIIADPAMSNRSIGVVSLLGNDQSKKIWQMLEQEIGLDKIRHHQITCGDARSFQGKERDIMFLSMVASPTDCRAISGQAYEQRFNVATSRAKDRMYLVRSVTTRHLSSNDFLRRKLLAHFQSPFASESYGVENLRDVCETDFEREIYDILCERGFRVLPQIKIGESFSFISPYCLDMVVEGNNDCRMAIECDGDQAFDFERWEENIRRQRTLERVGWKFWRCFAAHFYMAKETVIGDLLDTLHDNGIEPTGFDITPIARQVELRSYSVVIE